MCLGGISSIPFASSSPPQYPRLLSIRTPSLWPKTTNVNISVYYLVTSQRPSKGQRGPRLSASSHKSHRNRKGRRARISDPSPLHRSYLFGIGKHSPSITSHCHICDALSKGNVTGSFPLMDFVLGTSIMALLQMPGEPTG